MGLSSTYLTLSIAHSKVKLDLQHALETSYLRPISAATTTMDTQFNTTNETPNMAYLDLQAYTGLAHTMQTAAIAALVFAAVTYAPKVMRQVQLAKIPSFNTPKGTVQSTRNLFQEGYRKVNFI